MIEAACERNVIGAGVLNKKFDSAFFFVDDWRLVWFHRSPFKCE
jgi:hypothetical protein